MGTCYTRFKVDDDGALKASLGNDELAAAPRVQESKMSMNPRL